MTRDGCTIKYNIYKLIYNGYVSIYFTYVTLPMIDIL